MPNLPFDAVITLANCHLDAAGLDPQQCPNMVINAVRSAVQRIDGAKWVDIMVTDFPPACPGWVTLYPKGSSAIQDTPAWCEQRRQVEEMVKAALIAIAAPP